MKNQMELFDDGGLADEGGTVDPVSGNEVPAGSTQEEVRDDIPAQLSEGEFVLPADVVRYYGLEKIMQMRDEAKAGLARMEAMGQMGNADEAILDDDVPFSVDDLDMEDDGVLEYNQGGVVQPQGFTGIQQTVPSAFTSYQPQYTPYQAQPITQSVYTPPQQAAVPTMQQPQQLPSFQQFVQAPAGMAPENREYINPQTGERRIFTFINNQPTIAIPEGFIPISQYKEPEPVTTTPTVGQTRVTEDRDDGDGRPTTTGATAALGGTLLEDGTVKDPTIFSLSYDIPGGIPGIIGAVGSVIGLSKEGLPEGSFAKISKESNPDLVLALTPKYANKTVVGPDKSVTSEQSQEIANLYDKLEKANVKGQYGVDSARELAAAIDMGTLGRETGLGSGPTARGFGGTGRGRSDLDLGLRTASGVANTPAPEPQRDDNDDDNNSGPGVSFSDVNKSSPSKSASSGYGSYGGSLGGGFSSQATGDRTSGRTGFDKGGDVTKQMKKSGLTSKK